ncbi:hypothetical protein XELAEV_18038346mg [Xenopus laevis]|uniref:NTR domain-containing protein n=1 Tax=Xenopus laevis TaxID=8355 RepID=A0A974C701_XENLA|nr:hypothetical protein XELAEV_18038346mg [Xenopus laevis]
MGFPGRYLAKSQADVDWAGLKILSDRGPHWFDNVVLDPTTCMVNIGSPDSPYSIRREEECTTFFNPLTTNNLEKLCTGDKCKCIQATCPTAQRKIDTSITANARREVACKADVTYAYNVLVISSVEDGDFIKYTASIQDIYKKGGDFVKAKKEVKFIKKKTCTDIEIDQGEHYLIMGKEGIQIRIGFEFLYEYALDSDTWVEWWPPACNTAACEQFIDTLSEFSDKMLFDRC